MSLYSQIKSDITKGYKEPDSRMKVTLLKVLVSDIQRDPNKDYSDEKVIKVIIQTVKGLKSVPVVNTQEVQILEAYLPMKIGKAQISADLGKIDFSKLNNKMQAVGILLKKYPAGSVDGNLIKQMVQEI